MTFSLALCNFIFTFSFYRFFRPNMSTRLKIVQSFQHEVAGTSFWKPTPFLWLVGPLEGWRPVILVSMSNKGRWVVRRFLENSIWSKFSSVFSPCIYQREVGSETFSWKTIVWSKFSGRCHCPRRWYADLGKRGRHNLPYRCSQVGGLNSHLQCAQLQKTAFSLVKSRLALGSPGCSFDATMLKMAQYTGKCLLTAL